MINILEKKNCSGCSACAAICPKDCITMQVDEEGFKYPKVNNDECVKCGLCENICPVINPKEVLNNIPSAYATLNLNNEIRNQSSSGGIFYLLAEYVISLGGIVFGAKFDDDFRVVHDFADNLTDIKNFMGSKYLQSDMGKNYLKVKEFLNKGRIVLFTGTPCQIGGLKAFLGKDYENLICQDIICHGVPSPKVWKKYIEYRESKVKVKLLRTFFRHKKYGWKMYSLQFEFSNCNEYIQKHNEDLYMRSFLRNLDLRPSCYDCAFKNVSREADITLADFWGISDVAPEMDDDKGTSLVIVHSEKGKNLLDKIQSKIRLLQVDFYKAIEHNPSMIQSEAYNPKRNAFMKEIVVKPFDKVVKKYCKEKFTVKVKRKLKQMINKICH